MTQRIQKAVISTSRKMITVMMHTTITIQIKLEVKINLDNRDSFKTQTIHTPSLNLMDMATIHINFLQMR